MSWRRILLLSLLFIVVLGAATWAVLQRSDAATALVRRELAAVLATPSIIASTELDLANGRLVVFGLEVTDPTRPGVPLLRTQRVDLDVEADPFGDLIAVRRIAVTGWKVDLGAQRPTLAQLLRASFRNVTSGGTRDLRLPAIELSGGQVRLVARPDAAAIEIAGIEVTAMPSRQNLRLIVLRGTGLIAGLGASVSFEGTVDLDSNAVTITATVPTCAVSATTIAWLDQRIGLGIGELDAAGELRDLSVALTTTSADPRVEVRGTLGGARIKAEGLPRHISQADIAFTATTDRGGDLVLRLVQTTAQGDVDVTAEILALSKEPSFSLRAKGKNLVVDDDMLHALRLFPIGNRLVDALRPRAGRADIDLYLRDPQLPTGLVEFDMALRDVEMAYHGFESGGHRVGFPLPVVGASGHVRMRDDLVLLEGLTGRIAPSAGGAAVALSGRIDTVAVAGEDTTLDILAEDVAFTPELRAALADLLGDDGALYDRLSPTGKANVEVTIRPNAELASCWSVSITPRGPTVTWGGCPYRLDDLQGSIVARAAGVDFDLVGRHGAGSVALRGRIPLEDHAETGGFEVAVQVTDLNVDDELRAGVAVMAPAIDAPWQNCRPSGRCSGLVKAWRSDPSAPLQFDLRIDVADVDLDLPCQPWRACGLVGQLLIQGSGDEARIDFDALRGRLEHGSGEAARLAMLGTVTCGTTIGTDLSLVVRGLDLDDQLARTLEEFGALEAGVWDYLRPSGSVDIVCRHRLDKNGKDELRLVLQLLDVGSDAPILPQPARKMTGELRIADGRLTFEEIRADLAGNLVRCLNGSIGAATAPDTRTLIEFTVAAADFPLHSGMANLFPGPMHDAVLQRNLSGTADIDQLALRFLVPTHQCKLPLETVLGGQLRLQDVAMTLGTGPDGIRVEGIHGLVTLDESHIGDSGGELVGSMRDGSLRIFGQPFEAIASRFASDAQRIALYELASRFHGGLVTQGGVEPPAFVYTLPAAGTPDGRLAANLAYENVDVRSFLQKCGWSNPPYTGSARGHIVLERLDGTDIADATAKGALGISRGNLGAVPLFTAIYSQMPAPERPRFDQLDTTFRLADRLITYDDLSLHSNLLDAKGRGTLHLDGYLDVQLTLGSLLGNSADPLFTPLIDFLTKNIIRFHLFGHLRDLQAEKRWITEGAPKRPPVPPLPPIAARRALADY